MATTTLSTAPSDERVLRENRLKKLLRRPEFGALGGTVIAWIVFAIAARDTGFLTMLGTANYLEVASEFGILSVPVALLMIGGEFDLSVGSMIGGAGMIIAILSAQFGWNIWAAIFASLVVSLLIGALNGLLVVRTKLPSFIITLGGLFIIRGITIGATRLITGRTQVGDLPSLPGFDSASQLFASSLSILDPSSTRGVSAHFSVSILWWIIITIVATYILMRTRIGNWIFGMGGDPQAARNVGVPVDKLKIALFMTTAASAWLLATIQVLKAGSADTLRGEQREFYAIIGAVIGGTLLTGGYGSAIGAALGALLMGIVEQGIFFTGVDSDWFLAFLGSMLIGAVLINNFIRKRASQAK